MTNSRYISWVFLIVVLATALRLFHLPTEAASSSPLRLAASSDPVDVCSLHGFKCPGDEPCDCRELCTDGKELTPYRVLETDKVYVLDRRLSPGHYCLPRGVGDCDQNTSLEFYSLAGWSCIPKDASWISKQFPCHDPLARDNSLNVLWDYWKNEPAGAIRDYYETLADGRTLRYRCKCDSKDIYGTRMISVVPFVCSGDVCIEDVPDPLEFMGWTGTACECGPYPHEIEGDETSRCVRVEVKVDTGIQELRGRLDCMTEMATKRSPIYCPGTDDVYGFKVQVALDGNVGKFIDGWIERQDGKYDSIV